MQKFSKHLINIALNLHLVLFGVVFLSLCAGVSATAATSTQEAPEPEVSPLAEHSGERATSKPPRSALSNAENTEDRRRPGAVDVEKRVAQITRNMWWNQDRVTETLKLRMNQRTQMDQLFEDFMKARLRARGQSAQVNPFREALKKVDLEAARRAVEKRGEQAAQQATTEANMMLGILLLLDPKQLQQLPESAPRILRSPWFKDLGSQNRRRPRRGRPGQMGRGAAQDGGAGGARPERPTPPVDGPEGMQ